MLVIALTGCGTMFKLVEQPDGTYKKVPIVTAQTFFLDLEVEEEDTSIMDDAVFTMTDGTVVRAKNAILTQKRKYRTKGRGNDYAKGIGATAQGIASTTMP